MGVATLKDKEYILKQLRSLKQTIAENPANFCGLFVRRKAERVVADTIEFIEHIKVDGPRQDFECKKDDTQ